MKAWARSIARAMGVLSIPLSEYIAMRLYVRDGLGERIGFRVGTDTDYVVPALLAFVVLFRALERRHGNILKLCPKRLSQHLILVCIFVLVTPKLLALRVASPFLFAVWFTLTVGVLVTSLFVFLSPSWLLRADNRTAVAFTLLAAVSTLISKTALSGIWEPTAGVTSAIACNLIGSFEPALDCLEYVTPDGGARYALLKGPLFTLSVGGGCSGLEGIFLFLFLFCLLSATDSRRPSWGKLVFLASAGVLYMYVVNLVRIVLFFVMVSHLFVTWGTSPTASLLLEFYHLALGWVLYGPAILIFFLALYRKARSEVSPAAEKQVCLAPTLAEI